MPEPPPKSRRDRLVEFALITLSVMEYDEEWSADTLDEIASVATRLNLAKLDEDSMFKIIQP